VISCTQSHRFGNRDVDQGKSGAVRLQPVALRKRLTDAEWAEVGPLIPPAKSGGNKRTVDIRQVVNGVMYILSTGCQWRAIPKDLPPRGTVHDYLERWSWDGTLGRMHHALYVKMS
jgi:transposase